MRWMNWPLVEGSMQSWREWLQGETERDRPDGCQYDHPMEYCSACGTWLHCKTDDGPWERRPDDADFST